MEGSIPYLDRLIKVNPNYKQAGFMLGFAYQKMGNDPRAISEYQRFLVGRPENVQTRFNLAYALMTEGDCEAAIEHFKTVLTLKPDYKEVHLHLSTCYRELGAEASTVTHETSFKN